MMTDEQNKNVVNDFWRVFEANDHVALEELLAADFQAHAPVSAEPLSRDAHMQAVPMFNAAFSDRQFTVEAIVTESDLVATRTTMRGTHTGELQGHPPTGKRIATIGLTMERIHDGKIAERWFNFDIAGVLQELGISMETEHSQSGTSTR
jgi:steroid delta-isomerase-like uncharacterized protein